MTREEAIQRMKVISVAYMYDDEYTEAINMAIEALELLTSYEGTIVKLTTAIGEKGDDKDE